MYFKSGAKQAKLKSENNINNELVHTISLQSYKLQNHYFSPCFLLLRTINGMNTADTGRTQTVTIYIFLL